MVSLEALGVVGDDTGSGRFAPVHVSARFPPSTLAILPQKRRAPIDPVRVVGNEMTIPQDVRRVGVWNDGGRLDGGKGAVLVVGHVHYPGQGDGVLSRAAHLRRGDALVTRGQGVPQGWRVVGVRTYAKSKGLPRAIFRSTGRRTLVVVTCGDLDAEGRYTSNVVVRAVPVKTIIKQT